jgi:type I site-specific restriction-modification system R (restriction) subunit
MNSIRNMRGKIDDALKEQVKGFKEADAEYRELTNLVKELKKDWFTKDGKLKDNALSKIRNLTNKGNEAKLERLEKQFPGITRALK